MASSSASWALVGAPGSRRIPGAARGWRPLARHSLCGSPSSPLGRLAALGELAGLGRLHGAELGFDGVLDGLALFGSHSPYLFGVGSGWLARRRKRPRPSRFLSTM